MSRIELSERDQADIVAFLKSLTDRRLTTNPDFSDPFAPRKAGGGRR